MYTDAEVLKRLFQFLRCGTQMGIGISASLFPALEQIEGRRMIDRSLFLLMFPYCLGDILSLGSDRLSILL